MILNRESAFYGNVGPANGGKVYRFDSPIPIVLKGLADFESRYGNPFIIFQRGTSLAKRSWVTP